MSIYALISLLNSLILIALGNFVYYQNKRERLNIVFAFYCLFLSYVAFCEFMLRQAENLQTAWFWLKFSSLWPLSLGLLLHFTLYFTHTQPQRLKKRYRYLWIHLPVLLLSIGVLFLSEPVKQYWGYTFLRSKPMMSIGGLSGLYGFLSLFLVIRYFHQAPDIKQKKQAKYILLGQLFPAIASPLSEGILPLMKINLPESVTASTTIFALFAGFAIWRYQLFVINPATTAEKIIATMPDTFLLVNTDFRILETNPALLNLLGYEKNELTGRRLDLFFDTAGDAVTIIFAELLTRGIIQNMEINYRTKQGTLIPVLFSGSVIRDKQGQIAGIVGIGADIRETKQLQSQLFQSEKLAAVGQLAGGVAQEINRPISEILRLAQDRVRKITPGDPLHLPLTSIEREALRCQKLVGELLTFSQSGMGPVETLDLHQMLEETLSRMEAQTKLKGIEIQREYQPGLPGVTANKFQLSQAIVNVLNNAIDAIDATVTKEAIHTPPAGHGRISIATQCLDRQIEISIRDNGIGMTEAVKKHIFEPFFTTKDVGKGTGLGLSIGYEIIRKLQGSIEVESELGQGTRVIIKLSAAS